MGYLALTQRATSNSAGASWEDSGQGSFEKRLARGEDFWETICDKFVSRFLSSPAFCERRAFSFSLLLEPTDYASNCAHDCHGKLHFHFVSGDTQSGGAICCGEHADLDSTGCFISGFLRYRSWTSGLLEAPRHTGKRRKRFTMGSLPVVNLDLNKQHGRQGQFETGSSVTFCNFISHQRCIHRECQERRQTNTLFSDT